MDTIYKKIEYKDIVEHIEKNQNIFKISKNDISSGEGYEYRYPDFSKPLFGTTFAMEFQLAAFYHEYSHAIDMAFEDPNRILLPHFGMHYTTKVKVFERDYDQPVTSQATQRECRVIAIQAKLYAHTFNITEKKALEESIENMASSLLLMEDIYNIKIPNNSSLKEKEKENIRLDFITKNIKKFFNNLSINEIIEKTFIVSDYINYQKWSIERLEKEAYHEIPLIDLLEHINLPYNVWPEIKKPITKKEINNCIRNNKAELVDTLPWYKLETDIDREENRIKHIKKIAYFVLNDAKETISIDVGIEGLSEPNHIISDGNHRLAAAIFKKQEFINANISGDQERIKNMGLHNPNTFERELERIETLKHKKNIRLKL